jgi:hypothetical protein
VELEIVNEFPQKLYYFCSSNRINDENKIRKTMKQIKRFAFFLLTLIPFMVEAAGKEIPFTLDDRDRIIRTEQKIEALDAKIDSRTEALEAQIDLKVDGLRAEMNTRFESMDQRFDQLFNFLWVLAGIFSAMLATVFGFAFCDRKLSVSPMKRENAKIIESLREFSLHNPKLREILKNAGLQ